MRLLDQKFRSNKLKYIGQALLGGLAVGIALQTFDVVNKPVIIASFGASAFIAFTMPNQPISRPRCLIGGYAVGLVVGVLMNTLTFLPAEAYILQKEIEITGGAIAVALAMFLMSITNTEHAPATGVALGLVINEWSLLTLGQIMAGIVVISAIQRLLRPWMMDLIE
ncbi:MAG: HPP family protein [Candidatus Omnitrophota bacterium]|jgi:CBS-domain-containing membrane protein